MAAIDRKIVPQAELKCRVCGGTRAASRFEAREMMHGSRERFEYFECAACGSLQPVTLPDDVARFYDQGYYTFEERPQLERPGPIGRFLRRARARHVLGRFSGPGWILTRFRGIPPLLRWARQSGAGLDSSILDVGCGSGTLLHAMRDAGFRDLTGIDPYLPPDAIGARGIRFERISIAKMVGEFELIMFHHSLEHVPDPGRTLSAAERLLAPGGCVLVRIPIADSEAWERYGADWVQLDAPRHLFVPTTKALRSLSIGCGLSVQAIEHDSTAFQFWGSELYRRDIPLDDAAIETVFSVAELATFEGEAARLNAAGRGDQVCLYLCRAKTRRVAAVRARA